MSRSLLLVVLLFAMSSAGRAQPAETVVLLHGLGLRGWAMWPLQRALAREGYRVVNLTYPSRRVPLEQLAAHGCRRICAPAESARRRG